MKKLSKDAGETWEQTVTRLRESQAVIEARFGEVVEALAELNSAIAGYNDALAEFNELRDDLVAQMEEYASERSEKWRESEAGTEYEEWKSAWEDVDVTPLDEVEIDELDFPHADDIEALPSEPGESY